MGKQNIQAKKVFEKWFFYLLLYTEVGAFKECNLARIPSRVVISRPSDNVLELKRRLLRLDRELRKKPNVFQLFNSSTYGGRELKRRLLRLDRELRKKPNVFQLFNSSTYGDRDLLFKDSTVKLIHLKERNTTKRWLGEKYFLGLKTLSSCRYMAVVSTSFADKSESLRRKRFSLISLTIIVFALRLRA